MVSWNRGNAMQEQGFGPFPHLPMSSIFLSDACWKPRQSVKRLPDSLCDLPRLSFEILSVHGQDPVSFHGNVPVDHDGVDQVRRHAKKHVTKSILRVQRGRTRIVDKNEVCSRPFLQTTHCLSLIHISEPTRLGMTSYAVFCLKKK